MSTRSFFIQQRRTDVGVIAAIVLSLLLILTSAPAILAQAITVETDKTSYEPGDLLTASGVAPPNDEVVVQVLNPSGILVATGQTTADGAGNYVVPVMRFPPTPSNLFPFGSYTVRATAAAAGATVTTVVTFDSTAAPPPPPPENGVVAGGFEIDVTANGVYNRGDTGTINVLFTLNGALVDPTITIAHIHTPDQQLVQLLGTQGRIHAGWYYFEYTIPQNAEGTYGMHIGANTPSGGNNGHTSFHVTTTIARESSVVGIVPAITSQISNLRSDVSDIESRLMAEIDDIVPRIAEAQGAILARISDAQSSLADAIASVPAGITASVQGIQGNIVSEIDEAKADILASVEAIRDDTRAAAAGSSQASTMALVAAGLAALAVVLIIVVLVRKRG